MKIKSPGSKTTPFKTSTTFWTWHLALSQTIWGLEKQDQDKNINIYELLHNPDNEFIIRVLKYG